MHSPHGCTLAHKLTHTLGGEPDDKPKDDKEGKKEEDEDEPKELTFAQRYAGPEGSTVTIRQKPQAPYGIPGLPPVEGPSLTISNPGGGAEPEVSVCRITFYRCSVDRNICYIHTCCMLCTYIIIYFMCQWALTQPGGRGVI